MRKLFFGTPVFLLIVMLLGGCGGSSSGSNGLILPPPQTAAKPVQGVVTDPVSNTPVSNASVSAFVQLGNVVAKSVGAATAVQTVQTNANGSYTFTNLQPGVTYYFVITITGYADFNYYNVTPDANNSTVLEAARILPSSVASQTATVSGLVKNASTNLGLPNMTVKLRPGVNNKLGTTITAQQTTPSTGAYSFASLAAGTYTAEVTGNIGSTPIITSYFTLICVPGNTAVNTNQDFPVTTPLATTGSGQYRIVLSWGNNPSDLDSHLTGPTASAATRFHTYYSDPDYPYGSSTYDNAGFRIPGSTTEAVLDVDNTEHGIDNGPETTTIAQPRVGIYRFYVHHYAGTSNISASGAQVKVYKGSALLATYNPPTGAVGDDDVWNVFTLTVTAAGESIAPVNTITVARGYANLPKPVTGFEDYLLFNNLPAKK